MGSPSPAMVGGGGQEHISHVSPYGWGLPWVQRGLEGGGGTMYGAGGYGAGSPSLPARCGAPQCSSRGESHQYFMELLPPGAGLRASGSGCCCCPPPKQLLPFPWQPAPCFSPPPFFPPVSCAFWGGAFWGCKEPWGPNPNLESFGDDFCSRSQQIQQLGSPGAAPQLQDECPKPNGGGVVQEFGCPPSSVSSSERGPMAVSF